MGRVDGKVALVTGSAARGIGRACVERLAREGGTVFGSDARDELGRSEAARLRAEGLDVRFVPLDVTSDAQWRSAIETILGETDHLDILVNNAGVAVATSIARRR
jgi:NAD(P)-dependent dehydrogenase (short-subunit alcohol dehydrogenase family)